MDVEWAEISYLGAEKCVRTCVFKRYSASAFTPMVTWDEPDTHQRWRNLLPDGRCDAAAQTLFIKSITQGADLFSI